MWATGINGTATTCKNKKGRELISKDAALVGLFSHSCTNSDAFNALQDKLIAKRQEDMEQLRIEATFIEEASQAAPAELPPDGLPRALAFLRRNDTRCVGVMFSGYFMYVGVLYFCRVLAPLHVVATEAAALSLVCRLSYVWACEKQICRCSVL